MLINTNNADCRLVQSINLVLVLCSLEDLPLGVLSLPPDLLGLVEGRVLGLFLLAAAAAVLSLERVLEVRIES